MPRYPLRDRLDLFQVQRAAKRLAAEVGFGHHACQELAIVASELSSNVLKYGKGGVLELSSLDDEHGKGMILIAHDSGPPFRNLKMAMLDGHDDDGPIDPATIFKRGGMGAGLGAVIRLTHAFRVESEAQGKRVIAIRYLRRPSNRSRRPSPGSKFPSRGSKFPGRGSKFPKK
jgi:anti-sigma regulatory factor (Ser/Thr protein kinase)